MLLRDEEDIVAETLAHLLTWIDAVHVYDLGSTDATWDIVQDFAARDERIIPYKREPTVYSDGLRAVLLEHCRDRFRAGDWIVKIDADEFYPLPPPTFVRERLEPCEGMVYLQWYFFRLTTAEAGAYESGRVSLSDDRRRSIVERRRFYKVSHYSEPRLFRYRESMSWSAELCWPYNAGIVARERIPVRHYPHRDNVQMQQRFRLRAAIMELGGRTGDHWRLADWRQDLVDEASGLTVSREQGRKEGLAGESGIDTGPLLHWALGTVLPEVRLHDQAAPPLRRAAQRLVYATMLPWLDRRRLSQMPSYCPVIIPEAENVRIGAQRVANS